MADLTYGDDITVAIDNLPAVTVNALLQRAFNHIMGNEAAAAHPKDEDGFEAARATWRAKKIEQMIAGELGTREGGPRKDPVEAKFAELVAKSIRATLKAKGLKLISPKKDEEKFEPFVAFGNGARRTWKEMIANRSNSPEGEKLRAEAAKMVAAEAKVTKPRVTESAESAEELGL